MTAQGKYTAIVSRVDTDKIAGFRNIMIKTAKRRQTEISSINKL
jgi:hypothetical protein